MKKFIITEEEKKRIRGLYEQTTPSNTYSSDTSDLYSSILGYLVQHEDSIYNDATIDSLNMMVAKKEVRHFCEAKRDNKPAKALSKPAQVLFDTIGKMVKDSPNISDYIEIGRTVKSNDYV
jgi:hypothetical protein